MLHSLPRRQFSLDALIAEAKRRARQRRLLVAVGVVLVVGVASGLTLALRPPGASAGGSVYATYPSLPAAASAMHSLCAGRNVSGANDSSILWVPGGQRPLVFYAAANPVDKVFSTRGLAYPHFGIVWPCRPPVLVYYPRPRHLKAGWLSSVWITTLASKPSQRKQFKLGQFRLGSGDPYSFGGGNAIVGADGRIIFFSGTKIRYADGQEFTVQGLPHGWQLGGLALSPRNPSVFLAKAQNGARPPCGNGESAIYRISPNRTIKLKATDPCQDTSALTWSPDGRRILWDFGAKNKLYISDAFGRHFHQLGRRLAGYALWAPDGRSIAYQNATFPRHAKGRAVEPVTRAFVLNLATGASRFVGIGSLGAWSPDSRHLVLIRGPTPAPITIVSVPVAGGRAHVLFKIPAKSSR